MNYNSMTCDPERIEMFLMRQMSDEEQTAFEFHLDDCTDCRAQLQTTAAGDEIWSGVRESLQGESLPQNSIRLDGSLHDSATGDVGAFSHDSVLNLLAPTDDDRMLGRLGTYEVSAVIGSGGMGVVLKAFDAALNRNVAIKVLSPHLGSSGSARRRFSREAQAAAAVVHDNVIEIYGVADLGGLPYLVMPYVKGPSLQRRLDEDGPLETVEILRIGMQAAAGLAAAHAQGLVHRDVKPANILLADGVERVKLADFGLARAADDASLTRTGIIAGTPQYMSPEQARGESIGQQSDLFSLGSVLYAMCTGRSPFRAETSYGVLRRITDEEPKPIREINPDVPDWLCNIITKLLSKQPEDRFESAQKVADLLEECLAHVQQPTQVPLPKVTASLADSANDSGGRSRFTKFLWGAAFAFFAIFGALLISLELNKGTLTIKCDEDGVPIRVTQNDKVVKELTVSKDGKKVRVAAGTYIIEIDGKFDGISVTDGTVKLKRGETEVVRIVKQDKSVRVAEESVVADPLIGAWRLEEIYEGGTLGKAPEAYEAVVTFNGQIMVTEDNSGNDNPDLPYKLLPGNVIRISPLKADLIMLGRYKFVGKNELWLAVRLDFNANKPPLSAKPDPPEEKVAYARYVRNDNQAPPIPKPKESGQSLPDNAASPDKIVVTLSKDGTIMLDGVSLTATQLAARLREAQKKNTDQAVMIRANPERKYEDVVTILDICKRAEITNVKLAQSPAEGPAVQKPAKTAKEQLEQISAIESAAGNEEAGSEGHREVLRHAAEGYEQLHNKHRSQVVGLTARFHQARCLLKLGKNEQARGILQELLILPAESETLQNLKKSVREQLELIDTIDGNSSKRSPKRLHHFTTSFGVKRIACSSDGTLIAVANHNSALFLSKNKTGTIQGRDKPSVNVLDAETGKVIVSLQIYTEEEDAILTASSSVSQAEVTALAFHPKFWILAVGNSIGQVKLFDARTGHLVRTLDDEPARLRDKLTPETWKPIKRAMGSVTSLVFSPDGNSLAVAGQSFVDFSDIFDGVESLGRNVTAPGRLKVWDVKTGTIKHDLPGHSHASAVTFSPDGKLLASAGRWSSNSEDGTGVIIWNAQTGEKIRRIATKANGGIRSLAFSPNGKLIVFGSQQFDRENDTRHGTVTLANVKSGVTLWQQITPGWANPVAFSADGTTVVVLHDLSSDLIFQKIGTARDGTAIGEPVPRHAISILDAETGQSKPLIPVGNTSSKAQQNDFAITQKANRLVIGGVDSKMKGVVEIWQLASQDKAAQLEIKQSVQLKFSQPLEATLTWDSGTETSPPSSIQIPGRMNVVAGQKFSITLSRLEKLPRRITTITIQGEIEIPKIPEQTRSYLEHNAIPLDITAADIEQLSSNNFVTKVVYLPNAENVETATTGIETIVSTQLKANTDPVKEAKLRGTILAILRLGVQRSEKKAPVTLDPLIGTWRLEEVTPEDDRLAKTLMKSGVTTTFDGQTMTSEFESNIVFPSSNRYELLPGNVIRVYLGPEKIKLGRYKFIDDNTMWLATPSEHGLQPPRRARTNPAEKGVTYHRFVRVLKPEESEHQSLADATKQFNESTAQVRRELFDPPIADLTVERLREGFRISAKIYRQQGNREVADALLKIAETGRFPDEASHMIASGVHAKEKDGTTITRQVVPGLTLPDPTVSTGYSLIVLRPLELIYRKEGRTSKDYGDQFGLEKGRMLEEEELKQKETDAQSSLDYWRQNVGMKLGPTVEMNNEKIPFRGGLTIQTVQKDSRADQAGIRAGDILVGIDKWETASIENLTFIHKRLLKGTLSNPVKMYILRKKETLYTKMKFPLYLETDGKGQTVTETTHSLPKESVKELLPGE